jgi:hypothetical protein
MIHNRARNWFRAAAFLGLAAFAAIALTPPVRGQSQSGTAPQYTADGQLKVPQGFETWVFVGSNLGLAYKEELPVTTKVELRAPTSSNSTTSISTPRPTRILSRTRNSRTRLFW